MPILITSSFLEPHCRIVERRLASMGLNEPAPTRYTEYTPQDISRRLRSVGKPSSEGAGEANFGRAWEVATSSLIVENAFRLPWGWVDPDAVPLAGFWASFSKDVRFVFVWAPVEDVLADALRQPSARPDTDSVVDGWVRYHEAVLQAAEAHAARSLVLPLEAFLARGADLPAILKERLGLSLPFAGVAPDVAPPTALERLLAERFVEGKAAAASLEGRLRKASPLASSGSERGCSFEEVRDCYLLLRRGKAPAFAAAETSAAVREPSKPHGEGGVSTSLRAAQEEIELLRAQLSQVRQELRHYFIKAQESSGRQGPGKVSRLDAASRGGETSVVLDLRHFVDGSNWYHAEDDGRWAGPGVVSTLRLPALQAGRYRIDLLVVAEVEPGLLSGMRGELGGHRVRWRGNILAEANGTLAPLRRLRDRFRPAARRAFPRRASGTVAIPEAKGPVDLRLHFPRTVSPVSESGPDARQLSIRVQTVSIERIAGEA